MKFSTFSIISLLPLLTAAHPKPNPCCTPNKPINSSTQRSIFQKYVHDFYISKNATAAFEIVVPSYIQHNPLVADGKQAALDFLTPFLPTQNITILHTALENNIGWIHWKDEGLNPRPTAFVDIVRFEGGCIVEHWDVIQEVPEKSANSHPMF